MKAVSMMLGVFLAVASFGNLSAYSTSDSVSSSTAHGEKHGDFVMLGLGARNSVLLSNNYFYAPTREKEARLIRHWKLQDPIRALKVKKEDHRYTLTNLRTGESIKTRIFSWE